MLYIDGLSLSKIKDELKNSLENKKIGKIFQNSSLSLSFHFGKTALFFSCNPSLPICYINEDKEENFLEDNSNFLLVLRKYLVNSALVDVEQMGYDRILKFHFSKLNELGEMKNYFLYFEIMGKHSNIILTDSEDRIITLLKRFSIEENSLRTLFQGAVYVQPIVEKEKKINPEEVTRDDFERFIEEKTALQNIEGIGKKALETLKTYDDLKRILKDKISPKIFFKDNTPVFVTVLNIEPKNYDEMREYTSFSEMVNVYIRANSLSNSYLLLKNKLVSAVEKELKKIEKIIKNIEKDIVIMSEHEKYKNMGDILASVLYSVKKGDKSVKAYDFYDNKEIVISLDPLLNPQGNLNKIYKKSSKMKRGLEISKERLVYFNQRILYLESVLGFIDKSSDMNGLKNIEDELSGEKIINLKNKPKKNKKKEAENYGTIIIDNKTIYFGRNNKENDFLTFKFARKDDVWFHIKDIPGSHFIVKKDDFSDDEKFIEKVALCAAFYSKAGKGQKVVVEYTEKKNLNKPNGAPLGFVTYNIAKTFITEVPEKLEF